MSSVVSLIRSRAAWLLGLIGLALAQTGCAHPVWVEPSVVVQARVGGPVYGPVYGPPAVVVSPVPVWGAPPVVMPPRVMAPVAVYRPGWHGGYRGHHHGHRHGDWR